jgi:nucleotide-binding universal stress UspA family protein
MFEVKRVLCPVDLTELSIRPLAYAGAIANWYRAQLTALHVVPTFEPMEVRAGALFDPVQFVYPMSREQVLERLREAVHTAGAIDQANVAAEAGEPAAVIVDQASAHRADLLVMATHGRSGFDRLLLGSVTEKVLWRAPCPVLIVPPHAADSPDGVSLTTILCPVDFSPAALQAVGFAVDLARRANASVTFLQAIEWLAEEEPGEPPRFNVPEFRLYLMQDAEEQLNALIAQQPRVGRGCKAAVVAGRAHREILRSAAENGASLIVMGAQGRGGPALMPLGSTTQQVVRAASCPVLTIRAPRKEERGS